MPEPAPLPRVLILDADASARAAIVALLAREWRVVEAAAPDEGLEILRRGEPFEVVLSAMRMEGTSGAEFLASVRSIQPLAVRILLTAADDVATAIEAINRGHVYKYLRKPWVAEGLRAELREAHRYHAVRAAEHRLLEETLGGSVQVLTQILGMTSPAAHAAGVEVHARLEELCRELDVPFSWTLDLAGLLSQIGGATVPDELVARVWSGKRVSPAELEQFEALAQAGAHLIEHIPRLENVVRSIRQQFETPSGFDPDDRASVGEHDLEAELLRAAVAYVRIGGDGGEAAIEGVDARFHPRVREALRAMAQTHDTRPGAEVRLSELRVGMTLRQDVRTGAGAMVAPAGTRITQVLLFQLRKFVGAEHLFSVLMPGVESRGATIRSVR